MALRLGVWRQTVTNHRADQRKRLEVRSLRGLQPWARRCRQCDDHSGADLHRAPFTEEAVLTDGGVYDNLGLERVWKRCRTILVSNAGRSTPEIGSPTGRWTGQLFRTLHLVQQQAENSRKRILFGMHNLDHRTVAFWSIDTPICGYGLADALPMTTEVATVAATMRTRLNRFKPDEIDLLLKSGFAGADASLRSRKLADNSPSADFRRLPLSNAR
jgi:NTE family protein